MGDDRGYCPWQHLRGLPHLTFGVTSLPWGKAWWLPDEQAIVLDTSLTRAERRQYLAHELVHAEDDDRNCADQGRDGARLARRRERQVDMVVARRLMPVGLLADTLRWALGPDEVAAVLGVDERLVRLRVRHLTDEERTIIDGIIDSEEYVA